MNTTTNAVKHEPFCLPRPGETEPRMETFLTTRYDPDGVTVIARLRCTRCQECGAQEIRG